MTGQTGPISPDPLGSKQISSQERKDQATSFKSNMQKPFEPDKTSSSGAVTPMEMQAGKVAAGPATVPGLLAQMDSAKANFDQIRQHLDTPKLTMKKQHQYLLKNKLQDATHHIRSAGNRLGANMPDPPKVNVNANPIMKFIGYVTDGQNQLMAAKAKLQEYGKNPKQIDPANMMLVQVKLSQAQQELEYSSILLSKVVDVFKQMMNIQL